jgi:hypothetical protein
VPQQILEENLHRIGKTADFRVARELKGGEVENVDVLSADRETGPSSEAVHGRHHETSEGQTF